MKRANLVFERTDVVICSAYLGLAGECRIRVDLEANGIVPPLERFDQCGSDSGKWVEHNTVRWTA